MGFYGCPDCPVSVPVYFIFLFSLIPKYNIWYLFIRYLAEICWNLFLGAASFWGSTGKNIAEYTNYPDINIPLDTF